MQLFLHYFDNSMTKKISQIGMLYMLYEIIMTKTVRGGRNIMKNLLILFVAFACILMCTYCNILYAQPDTLTIIHINDTHSNLDAFGAGKYGGIARAASVIGQWKTTEPNPILIHAGDIFVGNLFFNVYFGVPELQILNQLGFDAIVLGNHEFDVGPLNLAGILAEAGLNENFHILGTNIKNLGQVSELEPFVKSHAIKEFGNVSVGFIGITTPAANIESNPAPLYIDDQIVQSVMEMVIQLRGEGAEVIIVVSHLGRVFDMQIAEYLSGVDAIIGGHSHCVVDEVIYVNNIPIVQAGSFYRYVGKLTLIYDGESTAVHNYMLGEINESIPEEPTIAAVVEYLKLGVIEKYQDLTGNPYQPIATAHSHMHSKPVSFDTLDTPVGNLVTAAMLAYVEDADCALEPKGHIVEDIYEGLVTAADLFRVYPYGYDDNDGLGFRLASYKLAGIQIAGVLQALLQFIHPEMNDYEYLMQTAGLNFSIAKTADGLNLENIFIEGVPIQPDRLYTIVSSDQVVSYLQNLFGINPYDLEIHPVSVFQIVNDFAREYGTISDFKSTGKNIVTSVYEKTGEMTLYQFHLEQNYPNPFNPVTTIEFTLSRSDLVTLKIFNILGKEIVTLVNEDLSAGKHRYTFDASGLASGIYYFRLQAGTYVDTKQCIVLR
jgi:5'-nucleotidase / UDP-sugar diphosphatase